MIRIVHCKREPYNVYIGRPSLLGNPFEIGKYGDRDEVIRKYEEWVVNQPELVQLIGEIGKVEEDVVLGCWCTPKPCHGDVIKKLAEEWGDLVP